MESHWDLSFLATHKGPGKLTFPSGFRLEKFVQFAYDGVFYSAGFSSMTTRPGLAPVGVALPVFFIERPEK